MVKGENCIFRDINSKNTFLFLGPSKPKEDNNGWSNNPAGGPNQWGGPGGPGPVDQPRRDPGWGPPPNVKPVGGGIGD